LETAAGDCELQNSAVVNIVNSYVQKVTLLKCEKELWKVKQTKWWLLDTQVPEAC